MPPPMHRCLYWTEAGLLYARHENMHVGGVVHVCLKMSMHHIL